MYKYTNVDNIIIQLTVVSKINVNEKVCINQSGRISITQDTKFSGIYRWIYGENRTKCITFINNLVNDTLDKIYVYHKSIDDEIENDYKKQLVNLLQLTCNGLENMKITYENDSYMVSYLESIINKINLHTSYLVVIIQK